MEQLSSKKKKKVSVPFPVQQILVSNIFFLSLTIKELQKRFVKAKGQIFWNYLNGIIRFFDENDAVK